MKAPLRVYRMDGNEDEPAEIRKRERWQLDDLEFWKTSEAAIETFTYFVQSERGGPVKIGLARDPAKRLTELQTGSPLLLVIRHVLPLNCEALLHIRYADVRMHGEWFGAEDELLQHAATASRYYRRLYYGGPTINGKLEEAFAEFYSAMPIDQIERAIEYGVPILWTKGCRVDEIAGLLNLDERLVARRVAELPRRRKRAA